MGGKPRTKTLNGTPKIEKGIPIPQHRGVIQSTLLEMEAGDSVLVEIEKRNSWGAAITKLKNADEGDWITRTVDDDHVRIWRLE